MRDNVSRIHVESGLDALPVKKTTFTSANIDRLAADGGYESLTLYRLAGNYTDGTFAFQIQHADDNGSGAPGTYANVSATAYDTEQNASFANITNSGTAVNQKIGYIGGKRWVCVVCTVTGSPATGTGLDLVAVLGDARVNPTTA